MSGGGIQNTEVSLKTTIRSDLYALRCARMVILALLWESRNCSADNQPRLQNEN